MADTYWVDNTLFDGHAEGTVRDAYQSTIQLAADASSENDAYNNYGIWIVSGTGTGQSRRITDYNGTTQFAIVSAWTITPDTTSVYEITVGADTNTGANEGTGSTGAFRTWQKALDAVGAGDTVNIKAGRAYAEPVDLKTAGTLAAYIQLQGYKTTPGDWSTYLLAHPLTLPNDPIWDQYRAKTVGYPLTTSIVAGAIFHVMQAVWFDGTGDDPAFMLPDKDYITCRNCRASNSAQGFWGGSMEASCHGEYCLADGNANSGFDTGWFLVDCLSIGNDYGFLPAAGGGVIGCVAVANTSEGIAAGGSLTGPIMNNTIVGTGSGEDVGMNLPGFSVIVANNLLYNLGTGIKGRSSVDQVANIALCNGFFSVDTPRTNFPAGRGDVIGADPGFIDAANGDYRLRYDSPARGKGWPVYADIGALQRREIATHRPINLGVQV